MKYGALAVAAIAALAGCTHHKPNPVTLRITPPTPVYLQPAQGRVVTAVLVDMPPVAASPTEESPPPPR